MNRIKFKLNGIERSVGSEVSSNVMLLDYIRDFLQLPGTKYNCREGGCGACIVTTSKCPGGPSMAINSCLVAVTQCQDWNITTIEALGNRKKGYHVLQTTLAEHNGTQCGYCTPGWVMAMHGLMDQYKTPKRLDIEKGFGSNLCRCTGYRPIMEAFKLFGSDVPKGDRVIDIEDLYICKKSGKNCDKSNCDVNDWYLVGEEDIIGETMKKIVLQDGKIFYKATHLFDVLSLLKSNTRVPYMLIGGNTAKGAYPIDEYPPLMIDISEVPELKVKHLEQNLVVGAGLTLTEFIEVLNITSEEDGFSHLRKMATHVEKVAHIPVRNVGTIAGNLMIKHQHNSFPSDIFLLIETAGGQLKIVDSCNCWETVSMQNFLKLNMQGKVIANVLLPPLNETSHEFISFKIMPRAQSAVAIVNAGFLYKLDRPRNVVQNCRIVYGGLSPQFIRASATEAYLVGKPLFTNETLQGALKVLGQELVVVDDPPQMSAQFRELLAKSLFYKGLLTICPPSLLQERYKSGAVDLRESRQLSSGRQIFTTDPPKWPLNQPVPKVEALIQCAGEAQYTEDMPRMPYETYAAFVLSTISLGTIINMDASEALKMSGVTAFYTAKDIPGLNSFTPADGSFYQANEEVLCSGDIKYFNQPIGIIVAEDPHTAEMASKRVKVTYNIVGRPVIDIKEARKDNKRNTLFTTIPSTDRGKNIKKEFTGTTTFYGQYHFTMETLVCVARPTEEGLEVHSATQWLDGTQIMISRALNIPENKIDVYVKRIGGGYGIKISRSIQSAVACSLVVQKLNRPCRFIQPLTTNTRAVGKRLPCVNDYKVGVDGSGVIQYVDTTIYEDNGYMLNEKLTVLGSDLYYNCYDKTKWDYKAYDTVTDTAKNTWCRAPATFEAVSFAEHILERISYEMSIDPVDVRVANVDKAKYAVMLEMIDKLKVNANYITRKAAVNAFNKQNRWKKRGLRCTFVRWSPIGSAIFDINLSVFHADGSIIITHSGIEMGQGINTKAVQVAAYLLKVPMEKIQIKGNNTIICPNSFISGGSLASQGAVIGVRRACEQLLARLEPTRRSLTNPTWMELISAAYTANVDLQVHSFTSAVDEQKYDIFGISIGEMEVDILTGEHNFIRVDLLQDVGFSISPEVDIGQIEGAFVMGVGFYTSERLVYAHTGELLTDRSWNIHLPQARDIPEDMRVYFQPNSYSTSLIFGSKAIGEPPICLSPVAPFAIRAAIVSARAESGIPTSQWFDIDGPYNNEHICLATRTSISHFKFN